MNPERVGARPNMRFGATLRAVLLAIATAFLSFPSLFGAVIVVNNPGDGPALGSTTLREAVVASAPNDTITFAVDQSIILTQGEILIDHDLALQGPDLGTQTILRAIDAPPFRLFTISQGTVTFSHLTLRNGFVAKADVNMPAPPEDRQGGAIMNASPIDPLLQTFTHDNGGPTMTFTLKPGSPAIDHGNSVGLTTNERGLARVYDDPAVPNAPGGDGSDVGAFELQPAPPAILQNVSTRARVEFGDNVLIGGLIVTGQEEKTIVFRAIGPGGGFNDLLPDPALELHDANGDLITSNDNWTDTQQSEIELSDLAPLDPNDAAILIALLPDKYTAIVRGQNFGSGTALVEAYDLDPHLDSTLANISSREKVDTGDNVMIAGFILGGGGSRVGSLVRFPLYRPTGSHLGTA